MEWSGRCCRHSASYSGKWETTAGSVQQQHDSIFADESSTKPARMQQTHTAKRTQCGRAATKASKRYNRFVHLNNQISKMYVSSALFNYRFATITQAIKINNISNESLDNYLLKHVNRIYKSRIIILWKEWKAWLSRGQKEICDNESPLTKNSEYEK